MTDRICPSVRDRLTSAAKASEVIANGMTVAMSGYAMAGYPKAIPQELVNRKRGGQDIKINLITGANVPWLDKMLGESEVLSGRAPMIADRNLSSQVNAHQVRYVEQQMSKMPRLLRQRSLGPIDVAVVEALAITEDGIIPTSSVGLSSYLMEAASEIIIEVNTAQPEILFGIHDVYIPKPPPATEPIPLKSCTDRFGIPYIPVDVSKINYIIQTDYPEVDEPPAPYPPDSTKVAEFLLDFLQDEYPNTLSPTLPPIQTGFGNIADAVADVLNESNFENLRFFCGGISEKILNMLYVGKAAGISTAGISMNDNVVRMMGQISDLHERLVVRNGDMINNAEIIGRLGLIALNTGIEIDIYGNVNASHIGGSRVIYGIGGGANFAQNAELSIMLISSMGKQGAISNIVPMVSHQDICEHDIDVIITENGVADLRGLDEIQRAEAIISNCASDLYQRQLESYFQASKKLGGHHPQDPQRAFAWYSRLKEKGTMLE